MRCRVKQIKGMNAFNLIFDKQIDMTLSLLRLQEYFESPKFAGKRFSFEDYIEWYVDRFKEFGYLTEVGGMNIPGKQVKEFFRRFNDLSKKEYEIYNLLVNNDILCLRRFYIISTYGTDKDSKSYLSHEIRHAMFHLNDPYRNDIMVILEKHPVKEFRAKLIEHGYGKQVMDDEVHAYGMTGYDPIYTCQFNQLPIELQKLRRALKKVEKKYFDKSGKII